MWLEIDPRSATPVYQQVVDGVKAAVARGFLAPGDKIPSIRELAVELMLNPNTVAKAYQDLERSHVIQVIRGRGTYVALSPSPPDRDNRVAEIRETMQRLLVEAHHLQLSTDDVFQMFREVMDEWALLTASEGRVNSPGDENQEKRTTELHGRQAQGGVQRGKRDRDE